MKNKFLFLFLFSFFILSSFCFAIDYPMININDCYSNITVNVTAALTIDAGEYSIKDCTDLLNNTWQCNCTSSVPIILSVLPNTINNYTVTASYTSVRYTEEVHSGGGTYYPTIYHNVTINTTGNVTQNVSQNNSNNNVYIGNQTIPIKPIVNLTPPVDKTNFLNNSNSTPGNASFLGKEENGPGIFASIGNFFSNIFKSVWTFLTRPW